MNRRLALTRLTAGMTALVSAACGSRPAETRLTAENGRLRARPGQPNSVVQPGTVRLGLATGRDGSLFVPSGYRPDALAPLALLLHGAGGSGQRILDAYSAAAETKGLILLAPDSRAPTWDAIYAGSYGTDILFLDGALAWAFARCAIDPARVSVMGFSDGATYALGIGRINGDLFHRVAALSPGYLLPVTPIGKPRLFISHGTQDTILPIDAASRRIVPSLRNAGYNVEYHEFVGGHTVTPELRLAASSWVSAG